MTSGTPINRPVKPSFNAGSGLRSPLDSDNLTNQWKKNSVGNNSTFGLAIAVARHETMLAKLRRRILGMPPVSQSVSAQTFLPFQIYPAPNQTNSQNDPVTFQIRGGYVSYRSAWPNNGYGAQAWLGSALAGNYETYFYVQGTDPVNVDAQYPYFLTPGFIGYFDTPKVNNKGGDINIVYGAKTAINTGPEENGAQLVMNVNTSTSSEVTCMAVWVEITDNNGGTPSGQMYGQIFDGFTDIFPAPSPLVIPIAIVWPTIGYWAYFAEYLLSIGQPIFIPSNLQNGHAVNRYPGSPSSVFNSSVNYRGAFTADALNGQQFYPGDIVLNDVTQATVSTIKFYTYFICQKMNTLAAAPTAGVNWRAYSTTIPTT